MGVFLPEFANALGWEVAVESGSSYIELVDNIANEWVVFDILEHRLGGLDFFVVHGGRPAASAAALVGCGETGSGVLDDQLALELVKGGGHVKEQTPLGRAGVDILGKHLQSDATRCSTVIAVPSIREDSLNHTRYRAVKIPLKFHA